MSPGKVPAMPKHLVSNIRQKITTHANPLILTAGLLTASLSPVFVTTGIAHADINNTRADAFGTQEVAQNAAINGYGVPIYSNGSSSGDHTPITNNYVNGVLSGEEWQCVELVNRLYLTEGWTTSNWSGNGADLYANAPSGFSKEAQNSISYADPGDVLSL